MRESLNANITKHKVQVEKCWNFPLNSPQIKNYSFNTTEGKKTILDRTVWDCAAIFIGKKLSSDSPKAR